MVYSNVTQLDVREAKEVAFSFIKKFYNSVHGSTSSQTPVSQFYAQNATFELNYASERDRSFNADIDSEYSELSNRFSTFDLQKAAIKVLPGFAGAVSIAIENGFLESETESASFSQSFVLAPCAVGSATAYFVLGDSLAVSKIVKKEAKAVKPPVKPVTAKPVAPKPAPAKPEVIPTAEPVRAETKGEEVERKAPVEEVKKSNGKTSYASMAGTKPKATPVVERKPQPPRARKPAVEENKGAKFQPRRREKNDALKVFLKNVTQDVKKADINQAFQEFGEVKDIYFMSHKKAAYVELDSVDAVEKIVAQRKFVISGKNLEALYKNKPRGGADGKTGSHQEE